MNPLDKCLSILEKIENRSYRGKNRTVITLEDVTTLTDSFVLLSVDEQEIVRDCISETTSRILIGFTGRMAEKAIDTTDDIWIRRIYILHIIENFQFDYRENLRVLIFLSYASSRINTDESTIWKDVEKFALDDALKHLKPKKNINYEIVDLNPYGFEETRENGITKIQRINQ